MRHPGQLSAAQRAVLRDALALAEPDDAPRESVASLLEPARARAWLQALQPRIDAPGPAATASLFAKRWAFLATGAPLYAMSVFDQGLDAGIAQVWLDDAHDGRVWRSRLRLRGALCEPAPAGAARAAWRADLATRLFAGHLAPLWRALARAGGVAERILWENTAVRVYSLYEGRMDDLDAETRARATADYAWLRDEAPPAVFGLDHNPLARYDFPRTPVAGRARPVRFRKTCCLWYQVPHAREYCQACPLIKPGRRAPVVFDEA